MKLKLVSFFLLGTLLTGCNKGPQAGHGERPPQSVGVVTLKPERVEITTELPGRTAAYRIAEVRPQVSGIILKRLYTEGADVTKGEQLYQIDPATYEANYHRAEAAVEKSEALVRIAELLAERREKLIESKVISAHEYDDAKSAYQSALADLSGAKAAVEAAHIDLVYTKVLAPISGTIGRSNFTEGALVTSGQTKPLSTIQQLDPIYVDVTQSSTELLRLKRELDAGNLEKDGAQKATARLILEDGTEYAEKGTLEFSEVSVDMGTGSVTLRAVFPNPDHELLPGMFVRAVVTEGSKDNAILVPQRGVTRDQRGKPMALIVDKEDIVELRELEVNRTIGDKWLVTKGLVAGDRVILEGLQKVAPGAKVSPEEMPTKEEGAASTPSEGI